MGVLLMTFFHIPTSAERGRPPDAARRVDTQQWVLGLPDAPVELQQACGWYLVVEAAPPTPSASQVVESTVQVVNGVPTRVYSLRDKTADEIASDTQQANRATIEGRVTTLLGQLDTIAATSGTLTAAQLSGAVRQLAVGLRSVVRYQMNRLDSAD